jgi:cell division protein FtsL
MTAIAQPHRRSEEDLRVLRGRKTTRPIMAPWLIVALIAVSGFLGLGFAQTSLDRAAFDLAELDRALADQQAGNLELRLEIARLENPARIAPLAEEMGLVIPHTTRQLLVDLDADLPVFAGAETDKTNQ